MSDILSGGQIDESTSGPTPPKVDDRNRDILSEQKERQDQDAIGGTQFPPKPEPLPPIPEAPEITPPLPAIPSFDFNITGAATEETREIARQATIDVLKNVTINGQSPSIEGSTIAFNIPQEPSASEAFFFQGVAVPVNLSEGTQQLPQQVQDIQSVVISPPPRPTQEPSTEQENFLQPRYKELSEYKSFPEGQKYEGGELSNYKGLPEAEKYEGGELSDYKGLPEGEKYEGGKLSDYSTFRTNEEIEERKDQKREEDSQFDRESSIRQKGETIREFKERQEELKQERAEEAKREEHLKRVRDGDLTELPSGMIPVRFTRADGQKKILALMATELVGVVEGATAGDRTLTLPSEDSYYEGGGGSVPHPWKISLRTEDDVVQYKVELNSALYSGLGSFSNIAVTGLNFWASASVGYLYLFGVIENGECTEASIQGPENSLPDRIEFIEDEQNTFSTIIGYIYEDENGNLVVKQDAFHNFTLIQTCVDGKAALYPFAT